MSLVSNPRIKNVTMALAAAVLALLLWRACVPPEEGEAHPHVKGAPTVAPTPVSPQPTSAPKAPRIPLPGERILSGYGAEGMGLKEDLTLMFHCLDTFFLAAKGMKDRPLGANGEIAAALRGEGWVKVAFLPRDHPAFGAGGELVDRFGTPLFFHAETAGVFSIRSAGPDRVMWNGDDVQRQANGRFLNEEELASPSLR